MRDPDQVAVLVGHDILQDLGVVLDAGHPLLSCHHPLHPLVGGARAKDHVELGKEGFALSRRQQKRLDPLIVDQLGPIERVAESLFEVRGAPMMAIHPSIGEMP